MSILEKNNTKNVFPSQEQLRDILDKYQAGRLNDAEKLAISISQEFPKHQFAWKVLGVIFGQTGRNSEAVHANQTAVSLSPQDAEAHSNLGNVLKELGRLDEAEKSYKKAIALKPDYAEAHYNLGNILKELGRLDEAETSFKQAIALKPDHAQAQSNLGNIFKELGRLDEAEASYKKAIALKPDFAVAHYNLGITLKGLRKSDEAESCYQKAIALKPDYAEAYSNLGVTLKERGKLEEALASYKKAIALKPDYAEAHSNLGNVLQELTRLEDASASYSQAIALKPDFAEAFWNLHGIQKTLQEAEHWIDKCLIADINHVKAKLTKAALRFYQGDSKYFDSLMHSEFKHHAYMRSFLWAFSLPYLPILLFNKWYFFDEIIKKSITSRPFYEFGVWRASSFNYLVKIYKKGYGFDTFTGLPEDWRVGNRVEKKGSYPSDGIVPKIKGGEFIVGKFDDTLPVFFSKSRPMASVINFDADLYSSTICALNFSKSVIDRDTILIFDELLMNESWEHDEFKALNEFCSVNKFSYEVIAISFFTKQVAVKLIGI
jgi:Flp pilus assembly protein TadD